MPDNIRRLAAQFYPHLILAFIVLFLIVLVNGKDKHHYASGKYRFSLDFPVGWVKDHKKPMEISYRSPDLVPVLEEPEAAITVVVDERYDELDLAGHFNIIARDLVKAGAQISNTGQAHIGKEEALWLDFQDSNGLKNYTWYFLFNKTNRLLIIQYRVSVQDTEKYRPVFAKFLESFKIK